MWPLLEHPGQTQPQNLFCLATSWSSLSKHRSAFQLLKSYPKRANDWDSQLKLIPTYPQVRSGIGSPTRPCRIPEHISPSLGLRSMVRLCCLRLAWPLSAVFPQQRPDLDAHPFCVLCLPAASSLPTTSRGKISPSWHKCDNLQAPAV